MAVEITITAPPIDHDRKRKNPAAWHSVGLSLHYSAGVLWKKLGPVMQALASTKARSAPATKQALRLRGPFAMLEGMAIENMLKGVIVLGTGKSPRVSHDLVKLSKDAGENWGPQQLDVLKRLTMFVHWAGRYPVALNEAKTQERRVVKSTDYTTVCSIVSRLDQGRIQSATRGET